MMGQLAYQSGLGATTPQVTGGISASLLTAATIDPEPISKAILAAVGALLSFFKFGYDPKKLNDTALTEALIIGFNQSWEALTGEHLPYNCTPGKCGDQHVAIFTRSQWPNIPYPGGVPGVDLDSYLSAFQQAIAEGRSKLLRSQSLADYDANANYILTLLNQVKQRQGEEAAAANPITALLPSGSISSLLPWLIGGFAVYKLIL